MAFKLAALLCRWGNSRNCRACTYSRVVPAQAGTQASGHGVLPVKSLGLLFGEHSPFTTLWRASGFPPARE